MITLRINRERHRLDVDPTMPLLWALRDELGLRATKYGCGRGLCGACTVHLDGTPTRSCQVRVGDVGDRHVESLEGVRGRELERLQEAWAAENVPQCGYCQVGQLMTAVALLREVPRPDRAMVRERMTGNLCRCGTYQRIERAIRLASGQEVG